MKTRVWKRLTWDLRIVYNKVTEEYILQVYDLHWNDFRERDTMKKAVEEKHKIIKKRVKERGLFNENI